jgi:hypothetical protein
VNRSFSKGKLTSPKTEASIRAVPLQARALAALDQLPPGGPGDLLFPAKRGGYLDLHNFRNRNWKPAQQYPRWCSLRVPFARRLRLGVSTLAQAAAIWLDPTLAGSPST